MAFKENKYYGSPALAMSVFENSIEKYIFFDIDNDANVNVDSFAKNLSVIEKVVIKNQDTRLELGDMLENFPKSTLIHIDPYDILEKATNGVSFLELFKKASDLGMKCVLWYGFNTLKKKKLLNNTIKEELISIDKNTTFCKELIMELIQDDEITCNPGILGSGLLTNNLSENSINAIERYSEILVEMWKGSHYLQFNGDLYQETINLDL